MPGEVKKDFVPIEEQGDTRGQLDTDGRDSEFDDVPSRGGASEQPEAVSREHREERKQLTPAEERQAMYERIKEKRAEERAARDAEAASSGQQGADEAQGAADDQRQQDDPPADKPKRNRLVVNGREVYVDDDELIRRAQMSTASESALELAKEVVADARRLRQEALEEAARLRQTAGGRDSTHQRVSDEPPEQDAPDTRVKKIREIAEAIQTGDADDATKAITALVTEIRAEQSDLSPDEVAARANQLRELDEADKRFRQHIAEKHPEIVGRRGVQMEVQQRLHEETIAELRQLVGYDGRTLSEAHIARAAADPGKALEWLKKYSLEGVKRKDGKPAANPLQIFDRAAEAVKREFNLVKPAQKPVGDQNRQQQRREEKRQLMEPRPATSGQRPGGGQQQRLTPEQSRKKSVEARRQATGFDRIA